MASVNRRGFLRQTAAVAGGAALGAIPMQGLVARAQLAPAATDSLRMQAVVGEGGYGPLQPAGPELALPVGFAYRMFGVEGSMMSDGNPTPRAHDGMAAFALPTGNIRLIRNHEDRDTSARATLKGEPSRAYDAKGGGGTTSLEVRPTGNRELVKDFMSLNGTIVNCAGGLTPWGTWISSEETTQGETQGWLKDHGYNFEVAATAEDEVTPVPLKAMGRFVHEAVAVDPGTGIVYQTEDRGTAGFYRFIPSQPGNLALGGKLQMLAIRGKPNYNMTNGQKMGTPLPVTWVDIDEPDPAEAETNPLAVYQQGFAKGAAYFTRLEGCWYGNNSIYFHATDGGNERLGQVWEYRPRGKSDGQLILLFESSDPTELDGPDNICVSPRGGLVLCEDGDDGQYLRGLTPRGAIFDFALNVVNDREFAGACFSPDGQTLFVNIQGDTRSTDAAKNKGMTFAIWGPWGQGAL